MSPQPSGQKISQARNRHEMVSNVSPLKMVAACSSETSVGFQGLHSCVSQKIELLITTAVRNSKPTVSIPQNEGMVLFLVNINNLYVMDHIDLIH
jgi:hypothetical protein